MWQDSSCKAPIDKPEFTITRHKQDSGGEKIFTAEWSDEYKMWVCYPIIYYADGRRVDASGQIIQ